MGGAMRPKYFAVGVLGLFCLNVSADLANPTQLTHDEAAQIQNDILEFYKNKKDPNQMLQSERKYSVKKEQQIHPNEDKNGKVPETQAAILKQRKALLAEVTKNLQQQNDPSIKQAQALLQRAKYKATDEYQKHYCEKVLKKLIPKLDCNDKKAGKATSEGNDNVADLLHSYEVDIPGGKVVRSISDIPAKGMTGLPLWADDYWRMQWGLTSYRYSAKKEYTNYRTAIAAYTQPNEWLAGQNLNEVIKAWSPAEKYDLTVGDTEFTLTNEQKEEGTDSTEANGNVPDWMGICHGWSASSIMTPNPKKTVNKIKGPDGIEVVWYPSDVRAMGSLSWANGSYANNFIGGRCDLKHPGTFKNGRLRNQECFDSAPNTFTLALGNMIGLAKKAFVIDKTFDFEVWNQPVQSYELTYYNPLDPNAQTQDLKKDFEKVAVAYDAKFKAQDRFQGDGTKDNPMTRGKRNPSKGTWDDSKIDYIVGVKATVVYLQEITPEWGNTPGEEDLVRWSLHYDLELEENNKGDYIATGGEWHNNDHPDFLWVPQRGEVPSADQDDDYNYSGKPTAELTKAAAKSSKDDGYPLCDVVSYLVSKSSGTKTYTCQ
jgi:hypothetical protein